MATPLRERFIFRNVDIISVGAGLRAPTPTNEMNIHKRRSAYKAALTLRGVGKIDDTLTTNGVSKIKKALLYHHGIMASDRNGLGRDFRLAGIKVSSTDNITTTIGITGTNCWDDDDHDGDDVGESTKSKFYGISEAYVSDVTSIIRRKGGDGIYIFRPKVRPTTTTSSSMNDGFHGNGVSLIVIYDDGDDTNNVDVVILDGNDSNAAATTTVTTTTTTARTTSTTTTTTIAAATAAAASNQVNAIDADDDDHHHHRWKVKLKDGINCPGTAAVAVSSSSSNSNPDPPPPPCTTYVQLHVADGQQYDDGGVSISINQHRHPYNIDDGTTTSTTANNSEQGSGGGDDGSSLFDGSSVPPYPMRQDGNLWDIRTLDVTQYMMKPGIRNELIIVSGGGSSRSSKGGGSTTNNNNNNSDKDESDDSDVDDDCNAVIVAVVMVPHDNDIGGNIPESTTIISNTIDALTSIALTP